MIGNENYEPHVAVLMSTYNGAEYLREQIESILQQKDVQIELYIRDDGSTDGTQSILEEYNFYDNVHVNFAVNKGVIASFMELLYNVPKEYEYYAFSDQDDYWLEEKLKVAVDKIKEKNIPQLYFSRKIYVDYKLQPLPLKDYDVRGTSIGFALMNSCASGCTMVFNKLLHNELCLSHPEPKCMSMHDAWVYIVAAAVGEVIYDSNSYILYRQHGDNVSLLGTEMRNSPWAHWKLRFKTVLARRNDLRRSYYAQQILAEYGNKLNDRVYDIIYDLANVRKSYISRYRLCFSNKLHTQKRWEIVFIKMFIMLGWI